MIGDTSFDILMGRAAGVSTLGVSWGNHPTTDMLAAGAHHIVDQLPDLLHAITALTSPASSHDLIRTER